MLILVAVGLAGTLSGDWFAQRSVMAPRVRTALSIVLPPWAAAMSMAVCAWWRSKKAVGLDGALAKLGHASYGPYALGLVAAGLITFGLFSLSDARYHRI